MPPFAVRVANLSKKFTIGAGKSPDTVRDALVSRLRALVRRHGPAQRSADPFWALKEVSLEIQTGEVAGIIGRNGAGKSTLLKILARITAPTCGVAELHGRVGSLLEIGTGFHGELSGRENTYLNGAILGMRKKEIDRKFDEIVAFAEVERFVDTPVKHYSSGMYLRLAFAVAAHLESEILLVDEVLAVGDLAFQRKCLGKMGDVARQGRTILFVSHHLAAVEGLCTSAHLFAQGRLIESGPTKDVVHTYLASLPALCRTPLIDRTDRQGNAQLKLTGIQFFSGNRCPVEAIQSGEDLQIAVDYTSRHGTVKHVYMAIDIFAHTGQCLLSLCNVMVGTEFPALPHRGRFSCRIARFPLAPGQYPITLFCRANGDIADWVQQAAVLSVEPGDFFGTGRLPPPTHGGVLVPQQWEVEDHDDRGNDDGHERGRVDALW
jgi:homopolymeric O-antigen transport system ATP-binding protein